MSVRLTSGELYFFPTDTETRVSDLIEKLSVALDVPAHHVSLFLHESLAQPCDVVRPEEVYRALVEKKVDLFLHTVNGEITLTHKTLCGEYVTVLTDSFSPSSIEALRLTLWENGHDSADMSLTELFKSYLGDKVKIRLI
jgi:hypothetical protein